MAQAQTRSPRRASTNSPRRSSTSSRSYSNDQDHPSFKNIFSTTQSTSTMAHAQTRSPRRSSTSSHRNARSYSNDSLPSPHQRSSTRTFHRISSLDGPSGSSNKANSSTNDLGSLSNRGSRSSLNVSNHRQRPRRSKSLKTATTAIAVDEALHKKRSSSKPRSTKRSESLHDMELFQSMDAMERTEIMNRPSNATWEADSPASPIRRTNGSGGIHDLHSSEEDHHSSKRLSSSTHFSTTSAHFARRFLTDDSNGQESFQDEFSASYNDSGLTDKRDNRSMDDQDLSGDGDSSSGGNIPTVTSDLEWNPEIQRQQEDEWRKLRRAEEEERDVENNCHQNLFSHRQDLRQVDQSVNLMDSSMEDDIPPSRKKKNILSQLNSSMVDIWLDKDLTSGAVPPSLGDSLSARWQKMEEWKQKRGKKKKNRRPNRPSQYYNNYGERSCWRDLVCSRMALFFVLAVAFGTLIAWKTGAFYDDKGDQADAAINSTMAPSASPVDASNASATEEATATSASRVPPTVIQWDQQILIDELKVLLDKLNLAPPARVWEELNSPQYMALHWLAHLGAFPDNALASPNHKLVHPPEDPEAARDANTDSAGDTLRMMTDEDCIRLVGYALAVLFYSTNGDAEFSVDEDPAAASVWRNSINWMQPVPVCQWHGVICEENPLTESTVINQLNLTNNGLQGSLPAEVFQILFSLKVLDLSENHLTGPLPNDISVTLEEDMVTTPSLEYLFLNRNKLSGTLPTSWGQMTKLQNFQLESNQLTGPMPDQINQLENLKFFSVHSNTFSGKFPYIEGLQSLEYLYIYANNFTQHLPYEFFRIPSLIELRAQNNHMSGTIPPEIQNLGKLRVLRLEENAIVGPIPDFFNYLTNLSQIHLQRNNLEGPIPTTFGACTLLDKLLIDSNQLTGTIPADLSQLTGLREFRAFKNQLTGPMPASFCSLKDDHELIFVAVDCDNITDCTCCDECL